MKELKEALIKMQEAIDLLQKVALLKDSNGNYIHTDQEPMKIQDLAVKVDSLREANFVTNHIGAKQFDGHIIGQYIGEETCVIYLDLPFDSGYAEYGTLDTLIPGYTAVDFEFWTAQVGLDVPDFVMTSEDGVDLYEGDRGVEVINADEWVIGKNHIISSGSPDYFSKCRLCFKNREAAEEFIIQQNKPKLPVLIKVYPGCKIELNKLTLRIHIEDKYSSVSREFSASFIKGLLKQMDALQ